MKLTRTDWKYLVDALMFLCMVGIVLIGLLMGFVIAATGAVTAA